MQFFCFIIISQKLKPTIWDLFPWKVTYTSSFLLTITSIIFLFSAKFYFAANFLKRPTPNVKNLLSIFMLIHLSVMAFTVLLKFPTTRFS